MLLARRRLAPGNNHHVTTVTTTATTIVTIALQTLRIGITTFVMDLEEGLGMEGCSKRGGCGDILIPTVFLRRIVCQTWGFLYCFLQWIVCIVHY
jgi:hypothetical protein